MWARAGHGGTDALRNTQHAGSDAAFDPASHESTRIGPYQACFLPARRAESLTPAWRKVASRALISDPFLHPDWLAAIARHDIGLRELQILTLWRDGILCGLFPLIADSGFLRRSWRMPRLDSMASGAPFLLAGEADAVFAAACRVMRERAGALQIDLPDAGSPFHMLVETHSVATRLLPAPATSRRSAPAAVAGLPVRPGVESSTWSEPAASRTHTCTSIWTFRASGDPDFLRSGVEHFFDCDARSAAREGRKALLQDIGTVNAIRSATRAMVRDKSCRVALLLEGETVHAAAIVLLAHDRAKIWHEAVDSAHRDAAQELHRRLATALSRLRHAPVLDADAAKTWHRHSLGLAATPRPGLLRGFGRGTTLPQPSVENRLTARRSRPLHDRSRTGFTQGAGGSSAPRRAS